MKFLIVPMLLLMSCAQASSKPVVASSQPPVVEKPMLFSKFFVNFFKKETEEGPVAEEDCVYMDSQQNAKYFHFVFMCNGTLVHVGLEKPKE